MATGRARKPVKRRRRWLGVSLAVLVVGGVLGVMVWQERSVGQTSGASPTWRSGQPTSSGVATSSATPSGAGGTPPTPAPAGNRYDIARQQLKTLQVHGWDRTSDFQRSQFGEAWSDDVNVEFGHNGCNTRDDILRRDLRNLVVRPFTCFAQSGTLIDPYTGAAIEFVRGPRSSDTIEIDHVVALADAWYKGARAWDPQRRLDFANDPRNLLAVSPKANFDKAYRDASGWLPPNESFRCDFIARQIEVKAAYGLWLSAKEKHALADVLAHC